MLLAGGSVFRATNPDRSVVRGTRGSTEPSPPPSRTDGRAFSAVGGLASCPAARRRRLGREKNEERVGGRRGARGGEAVGEREDDDGGQAGKQAGRAGLPPLPHKYGFSRAVYDRKRVEPRERGAAPKLLKS